MENQTQQDPFLFDKRISKRNILAGRVSREEYKKFINALPDLENDCDDISDVIFGEGDTQATLTGDFKSEEENV